MCVVCVTCIFLLFMRKEGAAKVEEKKKVLILDGFLNFVVDLSSIFELK